MPISNNPSTSLRDDPTIITSDNIPDWYIADSVNLADYLVANVHRTVVRIFAREVIVDRDISLQASLSRPSLDLRIDCDAFVIQKTCTLDLSGSDTALGWNTYADHPDAQANPGEAGFDGGSFTLNAVSVLYGQPSATPFLLTVKTQGGPGGGGQAGYPGLPGQPGKDGIHYTSRFVGHHGSGIYVIDDPGTPPTDGTPGTAGTAGASGGVGGRSGPVVVCAAWVGKPVGSGPAPFFFSKPPLQPIPGGAGGAGGLGGPGGPPGAPTEIGERHASVASSAHVVTANNGASGSNGSNGAAGASTADVAQTFDGTTPPYRSMLVDGIPDSLDTRANQLFDCVLTQWARDGVTYTRADVEKRLSWLNDMAQPDATGANLPSIIARYAELIALPSTPLDFSKHVLGVKKEVHAAGVKQLSTVGTTQFAQDRPTLDAVAKHRAENSKARNKTLAALGIPPSQMDPEAGFYSGVQRLANAMHPSPQFLGGIELVPIGGITDAASCDAAAAATEEEICLAEAEMGPEGLIAAAATAVVFLAFSSIFGDLLDGAESAEQKAYEAALAKHAADMRAWRNEESERAAKDQANEAQLSKETNRATERLTWDKRRKDDEKPVAMFGAEFVGVLIDLATAEDGSGDQYAVLDGHLLPEISDETAVATYIVATYRAISFILTVKVPKGTGSLVLGAWHTLTIRTGSDGTLETAVSYIRPEVGGKTPLMAKGLRLLPPLPVSAALLSAAPPVLSKALDHLLQYIEVVNSDHVSAGAIPTGGLNALPDVTSITVFDVGQGAFHVAYGTPAGGGAAVACIAADMGGSSRASDSATVIAAMQAVHQKSDVPVIMSHWDADHFRMLCGAEGQTVQANNRVVGPSVCIKGTTLVNLLEAIASHAAGRLTLVGSHAANAVTLVANISRFNTWAAAAPHVPLPSNVAVTLTTQMDDGTSADRNNTEAVVLRLTGHNNSMLLPGDASFSYIQHSEKQDLTLLEATHHGSKLSLLRRNGAQGGTVIDNDIPTPKASAMNPEVVFSTNNRYGHGIALTGQFYACEFWVNQKETLLVGDVALPL